MSDSDIEAGKTGKISSFHYILIGLIILVVMFGGLGTWAAFAKLNGAVIAQGIVTVYSKRKTLQHLEGGIVSEILVRDGEQVDKGQLLVRLDDTRVTANLRIVDGQLDSLRASESRLKAERDDLKEVILPASLLARSESQEVAETLRGEVALFKARRSASEGEKDILLQRISQLKKQIVGLAAQRRAKERQGELLIEELMTVNELYEKGYASKTRKLSLERSIEALKSERGELVTETARVESTIGETELQIIQLRKESRQEVMEELHEVQTNIMDLEERRISAADEARRIEIRAPQGGIIVGLDVHTLGGIVSPGQPILDIVPEEDELVVEAQVLPSDIDKVQTGLEATVRFSAFNLRSTPEVIGTVAMVSADRMLDDANGLSYYLVSIRIKEDELSKLGELKLVPGMPAEIFVTTGERTPLSYLVKPLTDSLSRTFKEE